MGDLLMRNDRLEKRATEQELVARLTLDKQVSLKSQKRAEFLRSRIDELERRLDSLRRERSEE